MTKERPILFSGPMVRAILGGRKTQTRRVVTPQPYFEGGDVSPLGIDTWWRPSKPGTGIGKGECVLHDNLHLCPFGAPGDRLYVRETWRPVGPWEKEGGTIVYQCDGARISIENVRNLKPTVYVRTNDSRDTWRPSIHMPRWASRITLEVTGVRVERLQEISETDAKGEGVELLKAGFWKAYNCKEGFSTTAKRSFESLWDSINAKRGYGWATNPWVWVVEFRKL